MSEAPRRYRAGESIEDLCRGTCKATRQHTVMATDAEGQVLRVVCGFCGSQHNYRGGGSGETTPPRGVPAGGKPVPLVSEREGGPSPVSIGSAGDRDSDLEALLRRVLREEMGLTPVVPAEKWRGGDLVLRPQNRTLQEKVLPIETFFHKIVMLRNRLRTLEQQVNGADLPEDQKLRLQSYITGCYGSLTSFNILFADAEDQFHGSGGVIEG